MRLNKKEDSLIRYTNTSNLANCFSFLVRLIPDSGSCFVNEEKVNII